MSYPQPMCFSCQHYDDSTFELVCAVFPDGIPEGIIESKIDHRISLQGEPTFAQRPDLPEPDWEQIAPVEVVVASLRERVHQPLVAAASEWDESGAKGKYKRKFDEKKVKRDTDPGEEGQFTTKDDGGDGSKKKKKKKDSKPRQSARDKALAEAKEKGYKVTTYKDGSIYIHSPGGGKGFRPPSVPDSFEEFDKKQKEKEQKEATKGLREMDRNYKKAVSDSKKGAADYKRMTSGSPTSPLPGKAAAEQAEKDGELPKDFFDSAKNRQDFLGYADAQGWKTETKPDGTIIIVAPWGPVTVPKEKKPVKASGWNPSARMAAVANGWALPDGSYPIKDTVDWEKALVASQALTASANPDTVRRHLIKRGRELGIPNVEQRALIAASRRKFDPTLHPRGRDGKFIEVGGWIKGLIEWFDRDEDDPRRMRRNSARVLSIRRNPDDPDDPLIIVENRRGVMGEIRSSRASEAAPPKAKIDNVDRSGAPRVEELDEVHFEFGWGAESLWVKDTAPFALQYIPSGESYDPLTQNAPKGSMRFNGTSRAKALEWVDANLPPEYGEYLRTRWPRQKPKSQKPKSQLLPMDEPAPGSFARRQGGDMSRADARKLVNPDGFSRIDRSGRPDDIHTVPQQNRYSFGWGTEELDIQDTGGLYMATFTHDIDVEDGPDLLVEEVTAVDLVAWVDANLPPEYGQHLRSVGWKGPEEVGGPRSEDEDDLEAMKDLLRSKVHGVGVGQAFTPVSRGENEPDADFHHRVFTDGQERYEPVDEVAVASMAYRQSIGLAEPVLPVEGGWTNLAAPWPHYERTGAAFESLSSTPGDPKVQEAYDDLIKQTAAQMKVLEDMGITVEYLTPEEIIDRGLDPAGLNPYLSADAQAQDVRHNKRLMIASLGPYTEAHHPYLDSSVGGTYDQFRAVHDAFGHTAIGADFTRHGEYQAWLHHLSMFTGPAQQAASTELTGENSFLVTRRQPAPHKAAVLPVEFHPWNEDGTLKPEYFSPDGLEVGTPAGMTAAFVMPTNGNGPGLAELLGFNVPANRLDMVDNLYATYGVIKPRDILMGAVRLAEERNKVSA